MSKKSSEYNLNDYHWYPSVLTVLERTAGEKMDFKYFLLESMTKSLYIRFLGLFENIYYKVCQVVNVLKLCDR